MKDFAIIETGGKQLRVEPSQVITVERLSAEKEDPKQVILDKVLIARLGTSLNVGNPYLKGASVVCEYLGEKKDDKVVIFKMKRRKNYRRKKGHRQILTELRIKEIKGTS